MLQIVQIQEQQGRMASVPPDLGKVTLQFLLEVTAVEQISERIVVRQVHQLRFQVLALGDVEGDPLNGDKLPCHVIDGNIALFYPDNGAVLPKTAQGDRPSDVERLLPHPAIIRVDNSRAQLRIGIELFWGVARNGHDRRAYILKARRGDQPVAVNDDLRA